MGMMRSTAKRLCWWARARGAKASSPAPSAAGPLEHHLGALNQLSTHVVALRQRLASLRREAEEAQRGLEEVDRLFGEHHVALTQRIADELARYYVELESQQRIG